MDEVDVDITADLVSGLIREQFPQWSSRALTAVEPGGWDNRTYRLGEDMLVRLPSRQRYVPQVEKEHRWLPVLAPMLPLPIPTPVVMGKPGNGYPWPWSVYRAISALSDSIDSASATAVWESALASTWREPSVWVHGDVAANNLLVREGRLAAVIDFGSSGVGDPACDLTIAWTFFAGSARQVFQGSMSLDEEAWARARGWALWKALIVTRWETGGPSAVREARRVLSEVLEDHSKVRSMGGGRG